MPKFRKWENFDRDSKIYNLYIQGRTISEIWSIILKENETDLDFGNIKKIISSFPKKAGFKKVTSRKLKTKR